MRPFEILCLCGILLTFAAAAGAVQYQMVDLGPGAAYDVNDSGQVVGIDGSHAVVWQNGTETDLPVSSWAGGATAYAVNDHGQIVATNSSLGYGQGFLIQNGVATNLGLLPGCVGCIPYDINNSGQVVGTCYDQNGAGYGFIWQNGVMTGLGSLGGGRSSACSINESSQVVGTSNSLGFLWQNGSMTSLGELQEGAGSWACGINDSTQI